MKKILLSTFLLPLAGLTGFTVAHFPSRHNSVKNAGLAKNGGLVEVRSGEWPISLEKDYEGQGTSYSLIFRDQQVTNGVVMDTLAFSDVSQLKYFEKGLTTLKNGTNGDIATFKDYSIKRADKKYDGTWYILRIKFGLTDFKQTEADILTKTIRGL